MFYQLIWPIMLNLVSSLCIVVVTGFFAIHAMQRVADPMDRTAWLLIIVPFTVFGAAFYFFTKYRKFKQIGKGGLVRSGSKGRFKDFLALTDAERV